jgi:hypothetical protein
MKNEVLFVTSEVMAMFDSDFAVQDWMETTVLKQAVKRNDSETEADAYLSSVIIAAGVADQDKIIGDDGLVFRALNDL